MPPNSHRPLAEARNTLGVKVISANKVGWVTDNNCLYKWTTLGHIMKDISKNIRDSRQEFLSKYPPWFVVEYPSRRIWSSTGRRGNTGSIQAMLMHKLSKLLVSLSHEVQKSPRTSAGWWFQPLWKIWFRQWGWDYPTYYGKTCSKPPTRVCQQTQFFSTWTNCRTQKQHMLVIREMQMKSHIKVRSPSYELLYKPVKQIYNRIPQKTKR